MINGKYTQLHLARQFGGINTIGFTRSLVVILTERKKISLKRKNMIKKNMFLVIIIIFSLFSLLSCSKDNSDVKPIESGPYEYLSYEVLPTTTDPNITNGLSMQFAYITKEANLRKNKLFIFLPGTGASPKAYKKIIQTAAEHGYYSFGLHYDNSWSGSGICKNTNDESCVQNALKEYFEGIDYSSEVNVSFPNSFINRITKMILYLDEQNPSENWSQFLTANNEIKWNLISLAGHSMGSRHAFFISKQVSLYKVCLFSGPNGFVLANGNFPSWLSNVGATDNANITGFANLNDNLAKWNYVKNIWQIIGLQGTPLNIDNTNQLNSHQLFTEYVPQNNSGTVIAAHNSTCVDIDTPIEINGRPKFENVWKYMCFPD